MLIASVLLDVDSDKFRFEVRDICDSLERELDIRHDEIIDELLNLEDRKILKFIRSEGEMVTPYTKVRLTSRDRLEFMLKKPKE